VKWQFPETCIAVVDSTAVKYYQYQFKTIYKLSSNESYYPVMKSFKADLEAVSFVYVGTELGTNEEEAEVELPKRIKSANKIDLSLLPIIKSQLSYRNKLRIYERLIRSALSYGAKHVYCVVRRKARNI
jgi:hypothetical protein